MENLEIPTGYQRVMPYLIIKNATVFFNFMQKVFEATEKMKIMRDDTHIMHGELQIGESTIMFADSTEEFKPQTAGLFVYVQDADETYNKALEEGATSVTAMSKQDYGRSGGVLDPFGNVWWITSVKKY
ncbi:MAG: VOC family protein [Segetibacter sp.]